MSKTNQVEIEDFYPHNMCCRYGGIRPRHEKIESVFSQNLKEYEKLIDRFHFYINQFLAIPLLTSPGSPSEPAWFNGFIPAFDAISLFGLISIIKPKVYMEIGSGHSTKFAAKAKELNSPQTRIVSIDPCPRSEIDAICDEIIRKPLEECDMAIFDGLSDNDILFFDGTHRVLQNSDTEVFFFDVMPHLKHDIYIHLHDIFWPFDYPDEWAARMYSEQYVLGVLLLYAHDKFDIILPNTYISRCTELLKRFEELWNAPRLKGIENWGGSLWFKIK